MFFPCGPGQVRLGQRCRCPKRVTAAREAPIWAATEQPAPGAPTPGSARRLARRPGRVMGRCCTSGTKLDCAALWPVPIRISRPISQRQLGLYLNPPKECSDFVHRSEDHHLRSGPLQPPLCRCAPGRDVGPSSTSAMARSRGLPPRRVPNGKVLGCCAPRHRQPGRAQNLDGAWLAEATPERTLPSHPDCSRWLNHVEIWEV
jgi:hypothetical protein